MFSRIVSSISSALDLNLATLSGCNDIVVVRQKDGSLRSTPFHVRFGKGKLLRSREREVSISVNGCLTPLRMTLGAAGEAFFDSLSEEEHNADERAWVARDISETNCQEPQNKTGRKVTLKTSDEVTGTNDSRYSRDTLSKFEDSASFHSAPPTDMRATDNDAAKTSPAAKTFSNSFSFQTPADMKFSLCGHLLSNTDNQLNEDCFRANVLDWDDFNRNPKLWHHPALVVRFNSKTPYVPGRVALPLFASWVVFQRPLTAAALRTLSGLRRLSSSSSVNCGSSAELKNSDGLAWDRDSPSLSASLQFEQQDLAPLTSEMCVPLFSRCGSVGQRKRQTLRPTSFQLESLKLQDGENHITFTVTSQLQGVQSVHGSVYLWSSSAKIVVSDVDGTITRSDVLGQLMPIVGRDWSHLGVAELFSQCRKRNYEVLYLTARAIGQADATRDYLFGLLQGRDRVCLPAGPLIMSPDRLFPSFKREVIDRKPYVFKIAALRDVRRLFPEDHNPFYAGFGNRDTDHRAYVHIGIPESRVYIIDRDGTVHHIHSPDFTQTYSTIMAESDRVFPFLPAVEPDTAFFVRSNPKDCAPQDANDQEQMRRTKRVAPTIGFKPSQKTASDGKSDPFSPTAPFTSNAFENNPSAASDSLQSCLCSPSNAVPHVPYGDLGYNLKHPV